MFGINSEILDNVSPIKENKDIYIANLEKAQKDLCVALINKELDLEKWISDFNEYVENYNRLFYSVISRFIFSEKDDKIISLLLENINRVFSKIKKSNSTIDSTAPKLDIYLDTPAGNNDVEAFYLVSESSYKFLLKFKDHCELAGLQRLTYNHTHDSIKNEVINLFEEQYAKEYNLKIKPKLESYEQNITAQLIGLISIFTALSFVLFGSISILDNLLINIKTLPVLKVIFIGVLWMLCMVNIFAFFARIIFKLVSKKWELSRLVYISDAIIMGILVLIIIIYAKIYGMPYIF